jgi:hypothetical protein
MFQSTLLFLLDICLHALGVQSLSFIKLIKTLSMTFFGRSKVAGQSQKMMDFWNEFARNLRLPLAMAAG